MKLVLTQQELRYGALLLDTLIHTMSKETAHPLMLTKVTRLRYKFTPNASYLSVTQADRATLSLILLHRQKSLTDRNSLSEEVTLSRAILAKLVPTTEGPNEAA